MPDAGCRMPDAGCRMPDAGCRMLGVWDDSDFASPAVKKAFFENLHQNTDDADLADYL
jgi:hypothetical protein